MIRRDLTDETQTTFGFLFSDYGFQVSSQHTSEDFGNAFVIAQSDDFSLRFLLDRGIPSVEIGIASNPCEWIDLDIVRSLILGTDLLEAPGPDVLAEFLKTHYVKVRALMGNERVAATISELRKLAHARARRMFPQAFVK